MSATREIFVKEMADSLISRKAWVVTLLSCLLIPFSVFAHRNAQLERTSQQQETRSEYLETLELIPQRYPDFAGQIPADELEVKIFRESPELACLAAGLDPVLPDVVTLDLHGIAVELDRVSSEAPSFLMGRLDPLFLVQFVFSLLAILLTFDLISGEREAGTLKLILVNPVSRGRVLRGKIASALVLLIVPYTLAFGLAVLLLRWTGTGASSPDLWLRILVLYGISLLYLGCFVHLGAWVSSLTSSSLTSLVTLLFLWAVTTAIVPPGAELLAQRMYPTENAIALLQDKNRLRQELAEERLEELRPLAEEERYEELRREIADRYEARFQEAAQGMEADFRRKRERQTRLTRWLAGTSPASSLSLAWTALADTGTDYSRRFFQDVEAYQETLRSTIFAGTFRDFLAAGQARGRIQLIDPEEIPTPTLRSRGLRDALDEIWPQVLLLVLFNILPAVGAHIAFARYDVR